MRIIFFSILITSTLFSQSLKDMTFKNATVSKVTSIYDGDTFRADIKGYPPIVGKRMSIRIRGIDTPEIKSHCKKEKLLARSAKKLTVLLLRGAKHIELKNIKRGKYFRLIADVYVDNTSIADELMKKGYAVKYSGGHKINWCK